MYVTGLNISSAAEDNNKGWILSKFFTMLWKRKLYYHV